MSNISREFDNMILRDAKLLKPFSSVFFFLPFFMGLLLLFDLLSVWRKSKHSKNRELLGCCWIV